MVEPLRLSDICLELTTSPRAFEANGRRSEPYADIVPELGGPDPLRAWAEACWPDGLPGTAVVENVSLDPEHGRWSLRPHPDTPLGVRFAGLGRVPALVTYRRQARLVASELRFVPHGPVRDHEAVVHGLFFLDPAERWMDSHDLAALEGLPRRRASLEKRLAKWHGYLDWREKLIELARLDLPYEAFEARGGQLAFRLAPANVVLKRLAGTALEVVEAASPAADEDERFESRRRPREVRVGEVTQVRREELDGGSSREVVVVEPEDDDPEAFKRLVASIPSKGRLVESTRGDRATLKRQRDALDRLQRSGGFAPRLADWLFDMGAAWEPPPGTPDPLQGAELLASLNGEQREAVRKALSAPDVCLLQGPPGTGKTTVIAEIAFQVARAGGRVLLASQSNLAVDNALERLGSRPEMRPLRIGRADKVGPEHEEMLEAHVVGRWLRTVAEACGARRDARQAAVDGLERRGRAFDRLPAILERAKDARRRSQASRGRLNKARTARDDARESLASLRRKVEHATRVREAAKGLAAWARQPRGAAPPVELLRETSAWPVARAAVERVLRALPEEIARELMPDGSSHVSLGDALLLAERLLRAQAVAGEALAAVEAARVAVGAGDSKAGTDGARRRAALEARRQELAASTDPRELAALLAVNRELAALQRDAWSAATAELARLLPVLDPTRPPTSDDAWLAALAPPVDAGERLDQVAALATALAGPVAGALDALFAAIGARGEELASLCDREVSTAADALRKQEQAVETAERSVEEAAAEAERAAADLAAANAAWAEAWAEAGGEADGGEPGGSALAALRRRFERDREEATVEVEAHRRWCDVQDAWLQRLGTLTEEDQDTLRQLYVERANVVGLTCSEAGAHHFWGRPDLTPFDVVIVDEVSKATPPELVMPLLLGRRAVLVGDHRQLPPMFRERESSYEEALDLGELEARDFERFRSLVTAGLFEELFRRAPDSLRQSLWHQYRMAPPVMACINPFYDGRLRAGPDPATLAAARRHGMTVPDARGGLLLEPGQHALWIDSSTRADGEHAPERQKGTSKLNPLEVQLVCATLERFDEALRGMGYGARVELEVDRKEGGLTVRAWLESVLPDATPRALDDWLSLEQVRVNGRLADGMRVLAAGDRVEVERTKPVGAITFYGAQLGAIRDATRHLDLPALQLRTNTVDFFQGMERSIVIVSLVRSVKRLGGASFVRQFQRINVALSRAKELLVIVGAAQTFKQAAAHVELAPVDGGAPRKVHAYQQIHDLVRQHGGLRHASQLLG